MSGGGEASRHLLERGADKEYQDGAWYLGPFAARVLHIKRRLLASIIETVAPVPLHRLAAPARSSHSPCWNPRQHYC